MPRSLDDKIHILRCGGQTVGVKGVLHIVARPLDGEHGVGGRRRIPFGLRNEQTVPFVLFQPVFELGASLALIRKARLDLKVDAQLGFRAGDGEEPVASLIAHPFPLGGLREGGFRCHVRRKPSGNLRPQFLEPRLLGLRRELREVHARRVETHEQIVQGNV